MKQKFWITLFSSLVFFGCEKDKDGGVPALLPTSQLNISLEPANYSIETAELILSEHSGKILLDTLLLTRQQHTLEVRTLETEFVVTTVFHAKDYDKIIVDSYVQANPNNWQITPSDSYQYLPYNNDPSFGEGFEAATVKYLNVPPIPGDDFHFSNTYALRTGYNYNPSDGSLEIQYTKRISTNHTYFVVPESSLYKISAEVPKNATIDLAQMKEATKATYRTSQDLQEKSTLLFGYPVANNYNNYLWLYYTNFIRFQAGYDIIYPKSDIHAYKFISSWSDASSNAYQYYSFADSVPTHLSFIDESYIKLNSESFDNLSVQFDRDLPTYYASTWTDNNNEIFWTIFSPTTITAFNPKQFSNSLSPYLLKDRSLSNLKLAKVTIEKADDLSYQAFFNSVFNLNVNKENKIRLARRFTKNVN